MLATLLRQASAGLLLAAAAALASPLAQALEPCRLKGIERAVLCGQVQVPENPDTAQGRQITIHFAVVPAVAKNKAPDPLFVFAGGPGQAATKVADKLQPALAQLNARRDLVFVDQRGTGRSNALQCDRPRRVLTVSESIDQVRAISELQACIKTLDADLAQYATWIAMRDIDRVRAALGAEKINLWGGSYGTRAALEYLRQYPQHVRSVVLDGVAPAAMALPASFAIDSDIALKRMAETCAREARCKAHFPTLTSDIDAVLAAANKGTKVELVHPITGEDEMVTLDRTVLGGMLRSPLYVPQLAALLPHALSRAGQGDYAALLSLYAALSSSLENNMAEVMHFAVICAEDMGRVTPELLAANRKTRFGTSFYELYESACRHIPTRPVPAAFYEPPSASVPVLILSGGADPATPPRHGETVAKSLPNAMHIVAPNLGHGVTVHGCAPELISRFVRAGGFTDDKGKPLDGACLQRIPPPYAYRPPGASGR